MRKIITVCLLLMAFVSGCQRSSTPTGSTVISGGKKYTIAVVPKGTTNEFWKAIHAGAVKAAREMTQAGTTVEVIWKGPLREDDREQEIQVVEGFTSQGVNGIVLAPLDNRALVRPVEEAVRAGVPVVVIDSALDSNNIVSFVATDNIKGGELAADRMGELMGGRGKALLLRYQEGSASTTDREEGFLKELKAKYPNIELVSSDQYAGATRDTAKRAAENLLNRFGSDLQGVFCVNESSTEGMLLALQDMNKAGKLAFIGFDATDGFVTAMRDKQLQGFVVQKPFNMGYLGVKTMVEHLSGKSVEKRIDTGVILVTPDNVATSEAQELLHPPLDQYLK